LIQIAAMMARAISPVPILSHDFRIQMSRMEHPPAATAPRLSFPFQSQATL